ncbi:UNVERIFIED_CONTAM: hypothetical protein K2H54_001101 [Gekko kuhli]
MEQDCYVDLPVVLLFPMQSQTVGGQAQQSCSGGQALRPCKASLLPRSLKKYGALSRLLLLLLLFGRPLHAAQLPERREAGVPPLPSSRGQQSPWLQEAVQQSFRRLRE